MPKYNITTATVVVGKKTKGEQSDEHTHWRKSPWVCSGQRDQYKTNGGYHGRNYVMGCLGRPRRSEEGWRTRVIPLHWRAKVVVEDLQIEEQLVKVTKVLELEGWTTVF